MHWEALQKNGKLTLSSTNFAATEMNPSNSEILWIGMSGVATENELTLYKHGCNDNDSNIFAISDTQSFPYTVLWQFQGGDGSNVQEIFSNSPITVFPGDFDQAVVDHGCDPSEFVLPRQLSGAGAGDPHFMKWSGDWFDFHGICDQVLTSSPSFAHGLGLEIHIRTKPRYQYSYIEAAAIKIGNDVLQVGSWGQYWLNGVESVELPITMAKKYAVDRVVDNKKQHKFVITLDKFKMEAIVINVFKDMVNVNVENATMTNFGTSSGLLGGFPDGLMLARDGATIVEDNKLFGQEWQVLENDPELFTSPNPNQHVPGVCVPPVASEGRRLQEGIEREAAEKACAHHKEQLMKDMCVFDVMAMGDLDVAEMIHGA